MFLAYQPHLYEQQRRIEKKASPGFSSPSTSSFSSTTAREERQPSITSSTSTSSSTKRGSRDENGQFSKDDFNILTTSPISPSSTKSVFTRKRFHRPRTSGGGGNSKAASPAHFDTYSPLSRHHIEDGCDTQDTMTTMGVFKNLDAKYNDSSSAPGLHISIPSSGVYSDASPLSETTFASSGGQDGGFRSQHRSTGLDGLGISQPLDSLPLDEDRGTELGSIDLSHYPLPIRLGLIHPSQLNRSQRKRLCRPDHPFPTYPDVEVVKKAQQTQYNHGYYLFTPPPPPSKMETKIKSPVSHVSDYGKADSQVQNSHRMDVSRRMVTGRGRSSSDIVRSELMRRPSVKSHNSDNAQRWKLEQYFKIHKRKGAVQTREYKFHAFPSSEACYWWGYSVKTLTSESLVHDIINSTAGLSVLDWTKGPPSRVLDIGTGAGKWVLEMAKQWKESEFIGLDLVPVQTPLTHLQDVDLQSRVSWVVANALQGIPFPDHSFEYVHIRLINSGIPEDKWEYLLSEAVRVLTPDGELEILEADWSFFGSPKEMLTRDLQDLLLGQSRLNQEKLKMWKRRNGKRYDNLAAAAEGMLTRRLVKSDPASMIPFHLMNLDVSKIGQGKPRHLPVLARSSTYRSKKNREGNESTSAFQTKPWTPEVNDQSFTLRPQIGQPLPPHQFHVADLDTLRMAILVADVTRISDARIPIWEETRADLSNPCPWDHYGQFDQQMDEWYNDMIDRADLENLLKSTFDWNEAASRMDSRINLDRESRRRKKESPDADVMANLSMSNLAGLSSCFSPSLSNIGRMDHTGSPNLNNGSDGEDEDQDTVREGTPTPNSFQQTTAVLAFRTTTVFTAQKKT